MVVYTHCFRDNGGRDYVNNWVLRFEIDEAVKNVFVDDSFVFLAHMPSTIGTVLACFHLQQHWLTVIKKVDQDVDL